MRLSKLIILKLFFFAVTACSVSDFNPSGKKSKREAAAKNLANANALPSTDCSGLEADACKKRREEEQNSASHRIVDCKDKTALECTKAVEEEKARDGNNNSTFYVRDCKEDEKNTCKNLATSIGSDDDITDSHIPLDDIPIDMEPNGPNAEATGDTKQGMTKDCKTELEKVLAKPVVLIRTKDELISVSKEQANLKLAADINLAGSNFEPMPGHLLIFDGDGKTISGLTLKAGAKTPLKDDMVGLFSEVRCGIIKNINLSNVTIDLAGKPTPESTILKGVEWYGPVLAKARHSVTGEKEWYGHIGTLVGEGFDVSFDRINVKDVNAQIYDGQAIAGIVGYIWAGNISNSSVKNFKVAVSSSLNDPYAAYGVTVAGLTAGYYGVEPVNLTNLTVSNFGVHGYYNPDRYGNGVIVAGIIGRVNGPINLDGLSAADISVTAHPTINFGGALASALCDLRTLKNVHVKGVKVTGQDAILAGILGSLSGGVNLRDICPASHQTEIDNVSFEGELFGNEETNSAKTGGILGLLIGTRAKLSNCKSSGILQMTPNSIVPGPYTSSGYGGVIGMVNDGSATIVRSNCSSSASLQGPQFKPIVGNGEANVKFE